MSEKEGKPERIINNPELEPDNITLTAGKSIAIVYTEGALVASFKVNGQNILMPNQVYDVNGKSKKRGGVPYLNYAGPQHHKQGIFNLDLEQHGFARNEPWQVTNQSSDNVTLCLSDNERTRRQLPYAFQTEMTISLADDSIRWDWTTKNKGRLNKDMHTEMPATDALHPYFEVEEEQKTEIITNIPNFNPRSHDWGDPAQQIKDMPEDGVVTVTVPGKGTITMKASGQFRKIVLWTEKDKPHICVEPWVGGLYANLDRDQRVTIPENEKENFWVEISYEPEAPSDLN